VLRTARRGTYAPRRSPKYLRLGRVFVANMTGSVVFLGATKINNSPGDQLSGTTRGFGSENVAGPSIEVCEGAIASQAHDPLINAVAATMPGDTAARGARERPGQRARRYH